MRPYILTGMIAGALIIAASIVTTTPSESTAQSYEYKPGQTMISLSATEQMELKQDMLNASLRIEQDGSDAKDVQDKINKLMKDGLDIAKRQSEIKVSTGAYNVYSFDPNPQPNSTPEDVKKRTQWKGSQTIDLQGKNKDAILEVTGKLQTLGFAMNNLSYSLTPDQVEEYKDALMAKALEKIRARAAKAAKALGKRKFDIVEINIDAGGMPPIMYAKGGMARAEMAMASDVATPVAEAGEQTVSLTVNARVLMRD